MKYFVEVYGKTKRASEISLAGVFAPTTFEAIDYISKNNDLAAGFIVAPLLTSIASLLDQSCIEIANHSEKFIIYTGLLAYPSTGKSCAMKLFRDAIYEIENDSGVRGSASRVENGANFDQLVGLVVKHRSIVSLESHGCYFMECLKKAEREIISSLFDGFTFNDAIRTDRSYIRDPIFNLCIGTGPTYLIKELVQERNETENSQKSGDQNHNQFFNLFLFVCPLPAFPRRREHIRDDDSEFCSLKSLLYFVHELNKFKLKLKLNSEATDEYMQFYRVSKLIADQTSQTDPFLSFMYGKLGVILIRFCGIIHVLNLAIDNLKQIKDSNKMNVTGQFVSNLRAHLNQIVSHDVTNLVEVNAETVRQSIRLVDYFIKVKLILADYVEDSVDLNECVSIHKLILKKLS